MQVAPVAYWYYAQIRRDVPWLDWCGTVLSVDEQARSARYVRTKSAVDYRSSHGALRLWLSARTGMTPAALRFVADAGGKPEPVPKDWVFNLSHSETYWGAVFHSHPHAQVGIDIEAVARFSNAWPDLAGHILSCDEQVAWSDAPPRDPAIALACLWTRKEALLKAIGTGLIRPMGSISVGWDPGPLLIEALDMDGRAACWTIYDLVPLPVDVAGAVALRGKGHSMPSFQL